jgi:hypothetical protein
MTAARVLYRFVSATQDATVRLAAIVLQTGLHQRFNTPSAA